MRRMTSFQDIVKKGLTGPYHHPLRVKVIGSCKDVEYGSEGKRLKTIALSDGQSAFKAVCFDSSKFNRFIQNNGLVLRNIIIKSQEEIVITKQTKIYMTTPPDVDTVIELQGKQLICLIKPEAVDIDTAKKSPKKTRLSVRGQVVNEGMQTTVQSNKQDVDIKTITLSDSSGTIDVTLWRAHSKQDFHLGEFIDISNVVVNEYQNCINLNTTQYTEIEIIEEPDENITIEVLGYSDIDDEYEVITAQRGTFTVSKELFLEHFNSDILPKQVDVTTSGKNIKAIKDRKLLI